MLVMEFPRKTAFYLGAEARELRRIPSYMAMGRRFLLSGTEQLNQYFLFLSKSCIFFSTNFTINIYV